MSVITVKGNISSEVKTFTPQGSDKTVLSFSVANNDYSKKEGNEFVSVPVFYEVSMWVKNVEYWTNRLYKGNFFVGDCTNVHLNVWADNSGNPRASICVTTIGNPDVKEKQAQGNNPYPG